MQIRNNFGFVLAQRTNDQNLSRIQIEFLIFGELLKNFIQFCVCMGLCHKRLESIDVKVKALIAGCKV